jgi:tRNA threonylcarbamoyladenosine dehydratase
MEHAFTRTEQLIGQAALDRLRASKVAVFGIGGVGSFVVEGLARSGVGHFVLVDHDQVTLSNLNRQIIATHSTIGQSKVVVARNRILDINPQADVEIHAVFYAAETAADLVRPDLDYIVDAVDTVSAKVDLVCRAQSLGIPVISAMGAGNKLDPTRFQVTDIYRTTTCPLSRAMRRELKKRGVAALKVVYSPEEPLRPTLDGDAPEEPLRPALDGDAPEEPRRPAFDGDAPEEPLRPALDGDAPEEHTAEQPAAMVPGKRRAPGSVAFVPSVAGLIIAAEVVKDLITGVSGHATAGIIREGAAPVAGEPQSQSSDGGQP